MMRSLQHDFFELLRVMVARERQLRLGQSAASLSFITLLALVPLLTLALAALTAMPVFARILEAVQLVIVQNMLPDGFALTISRYLQQFVSKARTLSILGLAFLIVPATMMMLTLDRTLNLIWGAPRPRPLLHRVLIYWVVLLVGPILVGAGAVLAMAIAGGRRGMASGFLGMDGWDLVNFVLILGAFTLCYRWVPNVPVRWRHAFMGGLAGAALSEVGRSVFIGYVAAVPTYQQVYGPLAAIPALLIWTYLSWWVFLAGALLASILPGWRSSGARISVHHNKKGGIP
jgi:membrane protein